MKLTKRLLAMLLTVVMVLSMLPAIALTASAAYSGTGTFEKTTGTLTTGWYVFGYPSGSSLNAANNANSSNNWLTYTAVTPSSNKITNPAAAIVWYYDASAGTLQSYGDSSKYVRWPTTGNTATAGSPATPVTITDTGSGVYNISVTATPARLLRFNSTGWRFYQSSTGYANINFYKYAESAPSYTLTAQSNNTSYGTVGTPSNGTVACTPATGYYVASATVTSGAGLTVAVNGNTVTYSGTQTANAVITVNFAAKQTATLTYSENGSQHNHSGTHYVGDSITLADPNSSTSNGKTFVGWLPSTYALSDTAPTGLLAAGDSYTLSAATNTLHAVYATVEGGGGSGDYELVESAPDSWAGEYLIVYNNTYAMAGPNGNLAANTYALYTDISSYYSNKTITANSTTNALAYTFASSTTSGKYSVYGPAEGTKKGYIGFTGTSNGNMQWNSTYTASRDEWTVGVGSLVNVQYNARGLRWNNNSGQYRFTNYDSGSQGAIQLFKKAGGTTYSGYTTSPVAPAVDTYSVTITPPSANGTITTSDTLTGLEAGDTVTLTANPATGYEIDTWTITGAADAVESGNDVAIEIGTSDVTATVSFQKIDYTITTNAGANGSITAAASANYQDAVSFTVTPASGYQIASLTVKDASNQDVAFTGSGTSYEITSMPASNVTIAATFAAIPTYDYTFYGPNNSTVATGNAASVNAPAGSPASITYTYPGETTPTTFTFAGWVAGQAQQTTPGAVSGEIIPAGTPITLSADTTYRAVYTPAGSSGTGFKLSLESGGTTYYVGPRSSNNSYLDYPTDAADAAEFVLEEDSNNAGHYFMYYTSGANKIYIYNSSTAAGSDTGMEFTTNTAPSGSGYIYWVESISNGVATYQNVNSSGSGTRYLAFNSNRFSTYGTTYAYEFTKTGGAGYLTEPGANYFAVTYYENAGADTVTNMPDNGAVQEDTDYTIPATIPVRDGYRFDGWATSAGGAVVYAASSLPATISNVNAAINLYAKWTLRATVTFYDTDNATIFDTVYTYAGETPTAPASNPTKADSDPHYYTFAGWSRTAGGTVESLLAVIGSSESTRAYYPVFTEHTRIEAVDDSFVIDFAINAILPVMANDRNCDGATLTLGTAPTGVTLTKNGDNTITFAIPSGQLTTTYTFDYTLTLSGETSTATVTVKPSSAIYYDDSNSFFTYTDGTRGTWEQTGAVSISQTSVGADEDGYEAALTTAQASFGSQSVATVSSGSGGTWPTMTFTFIGTGAVLYVDADAGTGMFKVTDNGTSLGYFSTAYGASETNDNGNWNYNGEDTYYGTPQVVIGDPSATSGAASHTITVTPMYSRVYDTQNVGRYNVIFDGVRIYNPIAGSKTYTYTSFRDTVIEAGSLGIAAQGHSYAASVTPASLALHPGETGSVSATLTDGGSTVTGATPTYTTSDASVATVAADGTVTAVANGNATITATYTVQGNDYTATCAVTVTTLATYTVTYMVNGTTVDTETVRQGNDPSFTAPAASTYSGYDAHDYTFLGWIPSTISPDTSSAPATIYEAGDPYTLSGATTFHAVFSYTGEGSASGFTLSYTNSGTTYYLGTDNGSGGVAVSTDSSNAATYGMEQIGTSEYYYLYYLNGSDKIYLTGAAGSSSSTRTVTFSDANTQPSSGYYKWYIDSNNKFVCNNGSSDGGALQINTSDKTYAKMYTSAQWGAFTQTAASGVSATYYATTLNAETPVEHDYAATITPASLSLTVGGATGTVTAGLSDGGSAVPSGWTVTGYTSSDTSVATVTSAGVVSPVAAGTANITANVTYNGEGYTSPACVVTVSAATTRTVSFVDFEGDSYTTVIGYSDVNSYQITMPAAPSTTPTIDDADSGSVAFLGWVSSATTYDNVQGTLAAANYHAAGATYTPSADGETFKPVYTYTAGGGSSGYTQATSIAAGDTIVFAFKGTISSTTYTRVNGAVSSNGEYLEAVETTIASDYSTLSEVSGMVPFTVEAGSNTGTFAFKTGDHYLAWCGTANNKIALTATEKSDVTDWTVSIASGIATIGNYKSINDNSEDNYGLKFNESTSAFRFSCYKTYTTPNIRIYKLGGGASYYTTEPGVEYVESGVTIQTGGSDALTSYTLTADDDMTLTANVTTTTRAVSTVTWTTSNSSVISLSDATGTTTVAHAEGVGTARVTATCGSYTDYIDFTVNAAAVVTTYTYTVEYNANGTVTTETYTDTATSKTITLASGSSTTIGGNSAEFLGWVESTVAATTTTQTYAQAGSTVTLNSSSPNKTYYALYSYSSGGSGTVSHYELVTAAPTGGYAGTYLFVGEKSGTYYVLNGADTVANIDNASLTPTIDSNLLSSSNTVITANTTLNGYALTLAAATISSKNGYTIKGTDNNYLGNTKSSTSSTNRKFTKASSASTTNYLWAIDVTASDSKIVQNVGSTNYAFFNTSSTNVFRCYGSSNNSYNLSLYKYVEGTNTGSTTYYTTGSAASGVSLSTSTDSVSVAVNATTSFTVTASGAPGSSVTATPAASNVISVFYDSDDNTVNIYPLSTGTDTITVSYGGETVSVSVTVTPASGGSGTGTITKNGSGTYDSITYSLINSTTAGNEGAQPTYNASKNMGTRGVWATELSTAASSYYTGSYVYSSIMDKTGDTLLSSLRTLLKSNSGTKFVGNAGGHNISYDYFKTDAFNIECQGGDTSKVTLLYTGVLTNKSCGGTAGTNWNREHVWTQSGGNFGTGAQPGYDYHNIHADDVTTNGRRGNLKFGDLNESGTATTSSIGSTLGGWYNGTYFEPTDQVKGDVARIILYMYVMYGDTSYNCGDVTIQFQNLNTLLQWMALDPVDTWEMGRNDAVQHYQGNRNPFIDYPELAWNLFNKTVPTGYVTPCSASDGGYNNGTSAVGTEYAVMDTEPVYATRGGATRAVGDTETAAEGYIGAVMVNGYGRIDSDQVASYLQQYGAKNALYIPGGAAITFYLSGGSITSDIAIGASALTGTATNLKVIQVNTVSGTSVTGKVLIEQALASSTEMYYTIDASAMVWTEGESNSIVIVNTGLNPMMLTNLRTSAGTSGAIRGIHDNDGAILMCVDATTAADGAAVVRALANGTFNETPIDPTDPVDPIESEIILRGNSISLNGQIDVNFYLDVPAELEGVYATLDGVRVDFTEGQYGTMVSKKLPAKEMNTKVTLKLYAADGTPLSFKNGSATVTENRYSVQDYLTYVIGHPDAYGDELVKLCKAMSDYGAYTQIALDFDADNAKAIYLADEIAAVTCTGCDYSFTPNTENITFLGASVVTESETAIRVYFALTGEGFTATVDGEPAVIRTNERGTFVEVADISAKDLGSTHTITITNGTETVTISGYSVYSYVQSVLNYSGASASLVNAAKALKLYGDCAAEYFKEDD